MRIGPVTVSGGFLIVTALIYLLDDFGTLPLIGLSALIHELGHLAAIRAFGGNVLCLHLGAVGLRMDYQGRTIGYPGEIIIALMGPLFSLILAYGASLAGKALASETLYYLGGISLILCIFNLLPVYQLDGGRALYFLMVWLGDITLAQRVSCIVSCGVIFALLVAGTILLFLSGWNFTLLTAGIWLLISYCKSGENRIKYLLT